MSKPARDREYDRFGPWVLEICEEDPPPRLFAPHLRPVEPLASIKIPRKIARRDAHPGMDLYDYLISLYESDLVVLERVDTEVRARTVAYGDIQQLSVSEELLRGKLQLGLSGDAVTVPYNTVSNEVVVRVAGLIRERYLPAGERHATLPPTPQLGQLSFYFERLVQDLRAEGGGHVLAAQPNVALHSTQSNAVRRLVFGIVDKRLLESVHVCDGRELRIIDRGRPWAYRWQSVYGRRETFMPLANVTEVGWHAVSDGPSTLTLRTRGGETSWAFMGGEQGRGAYVEWLGRLA